MTTLYLASTSPRRQELIRRLGLPVKVVSNTAEERIEPQWTPAEAVENLSKKKANAAYQAQKQEMTNDGILIGADTIVVLNGKILGKPTDKAHAKAMLQALQGRSHEVLTGFTLIEHAAERALTGHSETTVWMKDLDNSQIERYMATGEPMDKAGGYDTSMYLGEICQYRVASQPPLGPKVVVGHTTSTVTIKPMSKEEIKAYVDTGEPLDKAGSYGVQGIGALFIEKIEGDFFSIMGFPLNLLYRVLTTEFGINPLVEGGFNQKKN